MEPRNVKLCVTEETLEKRVAVEVTDEQDAAYVAYLERLHHLQPGGLAEHVRITELMKAEYLADAVRNKHSPLASVNLMGTGEVKDTTTTVTESKNVEPEEKVVTGEKTPVKSHTQIESGTRRGRSRRRRRPRSASSPKQLTVEKPPYDPLDDEVGDASDDELDAHADESNGTRGDKFGEEPAHNEAAMSCTLDLRINISDPSHGETGPAQDESEFDEDHVDGHDEECDADDGEPNGETGPAQDESEFDEDHDEECDADNGEPNGETGPAQDEGEFDEDHGDRHDEECGADDGEPNGETGPAQDEGEFDEDHGDDPRVDDQSNDDNMDGEIEPMQFDDKGEFGDPCDEDHGYDLRDDEGEDHGYDEGESEYYEFEPG